MNSMRPFFVRCLGVTLVLTSLCFISGLSDGGPSVLPPDETAYSAEEVVALREAIATLQRLLDDSSLAPQRTFSTTGWFAWTSEQFAAYTAGVLAGSGYEAVLVREAGWPDGTHTWILVAVSAGERQAWIPVETCPALGEKQFALGRVAQQAKDGGALAFEEPYTHFAEVVTLPPNKVPHARIATPDLSVAITDWTTIAADGSYDPDGAIVIYVWDFGDGAPPTATTAKNVRHRFSATGKYTVSVTVVDLRGATATASLELESVLGCGCSG